MLVKIFSLQSWVLHLTSDRNSCLYIAVTSAISSFFNCQYNFTVKLLISVSAWKRWFLVDFSKFSNLQCTLVVVKSNAVLKYLLFICFKIRPRNSKIRDRNLNLLGRFMSSLDAHLKAVYKSTVNGTLALLALYRN